MVDPLNYFSLQPVLRDWCDKFIPAFRSLARAKCSSLVERPLTVPWIVGSIHCGEPIKLFRSSQCSKTGVKKKKVVVSAVMSVG